MSRRRVIALAVLACVLLGALALWGRSYSAAQSVWYVWGTVHEPGTDPRAPEWTTWKLYEVALESERGRLAVRMEDRTFRDFAPEWGERSWGYISRAPGPDRGPSTWGYGALGLGVRHWESQLETVTEASLPYWLVVVATAALMCLLLCGGAARRLRRGLCPVCGYDVKGGGSCPECGWKRRVDERGARSDGSAEA